MKKFLKGIGALALALALTISLVPHPVGATAISYVNQAAGCSSGAVTALSTTALNVTAGNMVAVYVSSQNGGVDGTVTDTAGNTYHETGAQFVGGGNTNYMNIWYAYNVTGNASDVITMTWGASGSFAVIEVRQFSGYGASDPYTGNRQTNTNTGTAMNTGVITAGTDSMIFAGAENDGNMTMSGSGVFVAANNTAGCFNYFGDGYGIVTGSTDATFTSLASSPWRMIGASFDAPSGGGSTPHAIVLQRGGIAVLKQGIEVIN